MSDESTSTSTVEQPDTGETTTTTTSDPAALAADVEKWQALARKHEERAKANASAAKELEQLRRSQMTEQEQAVEAAKAETRTATLREFGSRLVDAEVRAASAGRGIDVDALLEGLDRSRFITDDGDVDRKALAAWVDRIAPAQETTAVVPSFDGGVRTTHTTGSTAQQFAKTVGSLLT